MKPDYKLVAKSKYIELTSELAAALWSECYAKLYPAKQLAARIAEQQSVEAIEEQMDNDVNYFLVFLAGKPVGYFAWEMQNTSLHLMHLYLKPEVRGKAIGRDIVSYCERLARADGKGRVWATVHPKLLPVLKFFKERGYHKANSAAPDDTALELERFL